MIAFGDADFVIGALGGDADRLLRNDGAGRFTLEDTVMTLATPGTLGLAFADFNHDGRLDVVQAQGAQRGADSGHTQCLGAQRRAGWT